MSLIFLPSLFLLVLFFLFFFLLCLSFLFNINFFNPMHFLISFQLFCSLLHLFCCFCYLSFVVFVRFSFLRLLSYLRSEVTFLLAFIFIQSFCSFSFSWHYFHGILFAYTFSSIIQFYMFLYICLWQIESIVRSGIS